MPHQKFGHKSLTPQASYTDLDVPDEIRESMYADPSSTALPIFTPGGSINADIKGVSTLQFQRLQWYYTIISLSWSHMLLLSLALYLLVVFAFSVVYYILCTVCGANVTIVGALYFVVVSISANGGYMGEDASVLYPGHRCFAHRTYLVLIESYVSILLGAMIATVFIAKASTHSKLQHRVVFSDYVTLNMVSMDSFRMTFRVASIADRPMVHGKLRLYLITMTPVEAPTKTITKSKSSLNNSMTRRQSTYLTVQSPQHRPVRKPAVGRSTLANEVPAQEEGEITIHIPHGDLDESVLAGSMLHRTTSQYGTVNSDGSGRAEVRAEMFGNWAGDFGGAGSGGPQATSFHDPAAMSQSELPPHNDSIHRRLSLDPTAYLAGDSSGPAGGDATTSHRGASGNTMDEDAEDEEEHPMRLRIEELPWSCEEEIPLPGASGDLNLWFPATVHHIIDSDSPLYYIITGQPRPTEQGLYHRGHRHFQHQRAAATVNQFSGDDDDVANPVSGLYKKASMHRNNKGFARTHHQASAFQIAVVFEATDAATSTIIESKKIYTPDMLIAHYHFAWPTLLTQRSVPQGLMRDNSLGIAVSAKETTIDYFRLNELVPDDDDDDDDSDES